MAVFDHHPMPASRTSTSPDFKTHIRRTLLIPTPNKSNSRIYTSLCDLDDGDADQSKDGGYAMVNEGFCDELGARYFSGRGLMR